LIGNAALHFVLSVLDWEHKLFDIEAVSTVGKRKSSHSRDQMYLGHQAEATEMSPRQGVQLAFRTDQV
jgi:hypothetical protein